MSRIGESRKVTRAWVLLLFALVLPATVLAEMDQVTLRDGSEIVCRVLDLSKQRLTIEHEDGGHETIPRSSVAAIRFGEDVLPPIKVRVRVFGADDKVRIYVDGDEVASPGELKAGWVDLGPFLHDGANEINAEVENERNVWAYRWVLEAGTQRETFQCGIPRKSGCRAEGRSDRAFGVFPAGRAWIYVHHREGTAEIERP